MKKLKETETVFERVYVETPVDTDGDGKADLIAVYIRRPKSTLGGEKVPAVFVASPYMMTCNEDWYVPHDVDRELKAYPAQNIKEEDIRFDFDAPLRCPPSHMRETKGFAENAFVEDDFEFEALSDLYPHLNTLGYATVFSGGLGTLGSEGYTLTGSREEILAFKAVIDWLNGRCRAFTDKENNIEIRASWCTGNVAMSAKSYLGTMCIGVAATGVEGLKTIIPEAGISNWYAYYRYGGLNVPALGWQGDDLDILAKYCFSRAKDPEDYAKVRDGYDKALLALLEGEDRDSGNYNRFWDERNYLNQVENIKASVFIIHGLNDWNVKTNQCIPLFQALEKQGTERKMLLHRGEHIYVYDLENAGVLGMVERWLDHYLRGADNGVENEPKVLVESNLDQSKWLASDTWPCDRWDCASFPFDVAETSGDWIFTDDLGKTGYDSEKDNFGDWLDFMVLSGGNECTNRLKFEWDPFTGRKETGAIRVAGSEECGAIRVAGSVKVSFDAAIDRETAILSAMLVDIGKAKRITSEEVKLDDGTFRFALEENPSKYAVISRGWLNAQNRTSLWSKEEIVPGEFYHYEIEMVPTDHLLAEGHKLALIIYGADVQETLRPKTVTMVTVKAGSLKAEIPFAQG